jgi:hypothetical protein
LLHFSSDTVTITKERYYRLLEIEAQYQAQNEFSQKEEAMKIKEIIRVSCLLTFIVSISCQMSLGNSEDIEPPLETSSNQKIIYRTALSLAYEAKQLTSFLDNLNWRGYYQYKKDVRENPSKPETGRAITKTYSSSLQGITLLGSAHRMTYGGHYELDDGESPDDEQFTRTTPTGARKDAPDSIWQNYAA